MALTVKNNLRGYHYLASPAVQESLKPVISYIPRYMLFDRNGTLVETNTYHPSDIDKLYQQLHEQLELRWWGESKSFPTSPDGCHRGLFLRVHLPGYTTNDLPLFYFDKTLLPFDAQLVGSWAATDTIAAGGAGDAGPSPPPSKQ